MKSKGQLPSSTIVQWTNDHQLILEDLLDHLIDPPVMAYPDFTKPFIECTDASEEGLEPSCTKVKTVKQELLRMLLEA
jgi:hypothetical protein